MRDPRPVLLVVGAGLGVFLVASLYSQFVGNPASAPLVSPLTTLFVAVLAAYVAVHTLEFLNRRYQVREWRRDDAHGLLKPVYDDLLKIVPVIAKLESPNFSQFKPDFDQAEGSWQDWGLGSRLLEFSKAMENYEQLQGRAWGAAYGRFGAELRTALGPDPDPEQLVNGLYQTLYQGRAAAFGALLGVDPTLAMRFTAAYSAGATKRGNDTSPSAALDLLTKIFAAIADEPDVKVFRAVAEQTLRSAEKLRDEVRKVIRDASGVED